MRSFFYLNWSLSIVEQVSVILGSIAAILRRLQNLMLRFYYSRRLGRFYHYITIQKHMRMSFEIYESLKICKIWQIWHEKVINEHLHLFISRTIMKRSLKVGSFRRKETAKLFADDRMSGSLFEWTIKAFFV